MTGRLASVCFGALVAVASPRPDLYSRNARLSARAVRFQALIRQSRSVGCNTPGGRGLGSAPQ